MILKAVGAVLLFLSCSFAGMYFGLRDGYRIADLTQMKKALIILKSEIGFVKTPLPEAILNAALRTDKPVSLLLTRFGERLSEKLCEDLCLIWESTLNEYAKKTYFTDDDVSALKSLGKTLGYLDNKLQASGLDMAIAYIDDKLAQLSVDYVKNKKMCQSLGVLGGLALVIMMI